jgi:ADP-ribose pyrophosphatase
MIKSWLLKDSRVASCNRIFTLKVNTALSPLTGKAHEFYILEAGDWVNVIPITRDNEVLLVKQYRHGTQEVTLEIPGGLIDSGQSPVESAARELLEETGYQGASLKLLGRVRPNPAILNNWCYSFLARDVDMVQELRLDATEDIELFRVPLDEIPHYIGTGRIDHALVLSAFFLFFHADC